MIQCRCLQRLIFTLCCVAILDVTQTCLAIDFDEIARFNLDSTAGPMNPEFIGSNPSAIAWSGDRLFVAGFNNSPSDLVNTGLLEVLDATQMGNVATPTYQPMQTILSRAFRGYISLDISVDGGSLGVAYDDGQSFMEGFQVYNTSDRSQRWNFDARGSSGVAFDPGLGGVDSGVAFGAFGSGRRLLHDVNSGTQIYGTSDGMIWYDGVGGTTVRDIDFDPDTGDMYVRHSNQLSKATRTGGNTATQDGIIVALTQTDPPFLSHQNVSFLSNTAEGDLLILNDRDISGTGADYDFVDSMLVVDPTGTPVTSNFTFLNNEAPLPSGGWYDFDFDPTTQTLAISDNTNRNVHIFEVGDMMMELLGDYDDSDMVGAGDLGLVLGSWGGPPQPGWVNQIPDGNVGAAELSVVLGAWGNTALAVPEPASTALLCLGLVALMRRRS